MDWTQLWTHSLTAKDNYTTVIEHFTSNANTEESTAVQPMFYLHNM